MTKYLIPALGAILLLSFWFLGSHPTSTASKDKESDKMYPYEERYLHKQFPHYTSGIEARKSALYEVQRLSDLGYRTAGIWQTQGPGNIGARINTIAIHPTNPRILAIGYANGGVWITEDSCNTWRPVFDEQALCSIADIVFHPKLPQTLFVATGDKNIGSYFSIGNGLFRSDDMGKSWSYSGLEDAVILSNIVIDTANTDIMYAGAMGPVYEENDARGLYKSIDGGKSWSKSLTIDNRTGIIDIEIHPANSDIIYVSAWTRLRNNRQSSVNGANAGVYKSIDGGSNWTKLANGLPDTVTSRVNIAMAPQDPDVLYCMVVDADTQNPRGLFRTQDGGSSWDSIEIADGDFFSCLGGFGWYFGDVTVSPLDINEVFIQGIDLWSVTVDNTMGTLDLAADKWWTYIVHADKHDMVIQANGTAYLATDGGLYRADISKEEWYWEDVENIPTTEFYRTAYRPFVTESYVGGAQDNGTTWGNSQFITEWERVFGGDGFQPAFHNSKSEVWFVETQRGAIRYTDNNGQTFKNATEGIEGPRHWDMQYILSPHDNDVMFTATDRVYLSVGLPPLWSPISDFITDGPYPSLVAQATTLDQSPIDENVMAVGTTNGLVWVTSNGGVTWDSVQAGLPVGYVSCIKMSPIDKNVMYISYSGYRDGDYTPKVYRSRDLGNTWESISSDLPQVAVDDIFIYPYKGDSILFLGAEGGCFVSKNSGQNWERLGDNMPIVSVTDLDYDPINNELIAATYGRGIMTFNLNQAGISPEYSITDELAMMELLVYPNPSSQTLTIEAEGASIQPIEIISISGQKVYTGQLSKTLSIDVSQWPKGVYLVKSNEGVRKFYKN